MPSPVELIRKHIDAVARFDWDAVKASMMADANLTLEGVSDWKWEVIDLYRNISQAWDYTAIEADLVDVGGGLVTGRIVLLNAGWRKEVICDYRISSDLISSITFSASRPVNATKG